MMFRVKSYRGPALLWLVLAALAGCSDGRLPTDPAAGRVVFPDGSPVHVGTVELKSRTHGVQARGDIDSGGHFILTTYEPGDGAVAGKHDCVVVQMVMVEGIANFQPSTEGVVHPRFGSYSTSGLVVEVSDKGRNELQLNVEPLAPHQEPSNESHHQHDHTIHRHGADTESER
jgi:hypothetical protein